MAELVPMVVLEQNKIREAEGGPVIPAAPRHTQEARGQWQRQRSTAIANVLKGKTIAATSDEERVKAMIERYLCQ